MAQVWSVSDARHLSHLLLSLLPSLPVLPRISKWHPRPSLPGWCSSSALETAFLWHLRLAKRTGHRLKTIKKQFASTDLFGAFPAWPFISAIHRVSTLHHLWGGGNYPWRIRPSITALETPGGSKIHIYIYISHISNCRRISHRILLPCFFALPAICFNFIAFTKLALMEVFPFFSASWPIAFRALLHVGC